MVPDFRGFYRFRFLDDEEKPLRRGRRGSCGTNVYCGLPLRTHYTRSCGRHTRGAIHSRIASGGGILLSGSGRAVGSLPFTDLTASRLFLPFFFLGGGDYGSTMIPGKVIFF